MPIPSSYGSTVDFGSSFTIPIDIPVPYGNPLIYSLYITSPVNGEKEFTQYLLYHTTKKRINTVESCEITLASVSSSDETTYLVAGNTFKLFSENTLILKGRIDTWSKDSEWVGKIEGRGMSVKLIDSTLEDKDYVGEPGGTTGLVVTDFLYNILSTGTMHTYSADITVSGGSDSRLSAIQSCCDQLGWYWGVTQEYPYNIDYFNFEDPDQLSTTPVAAFTLQGVNQNIISSKNETDIDNQFDNITVLGAGEGVNQLRCNAYYSTSKRSTLSIELDAVSTTLTVANNSLFDKSGSLWVGSELIQYSGKSDDGVTLTGLSRGMPGGLSAYVHSIGISVYDSSATDVSTYLNKQKTIIDKTLVTQNSVDLRTQTELNKWRNPLNHIILTIANPKTVWASVKLGNYVTISDTISGISGNYIVDGMTGGFSEDEGEFLELEVGNWKKTLIDEITSIRKSTTAFESYSQGIHNNNSYSRSGTITSGTNLSTKIYLSSDFGTLSNAVLYWNSTDLFDIYAGPIGSEVLITTVGFTNSSYDLTSVLNALMDQWINVELRITGAIDPVTIDSDLHIKWVT